MSDAVMNPFMFPGDRQLVWLGFLLASSIIVAETSTQLDLPPTYDDNISEEIYQGAGGWRETNPVEREWRAPPPKKKKQGRINFGYDTESGYKYMGETPYHKEQADYNASKRTGLSGPEPTNTLFKLEF
jgi:hypothetical protein